jgi:hypothetical protein
MPSAFNVGSSPITTNGTLAVTGAGTTAQYVRGDGSLATFPGLTGFVPYTGATADVNLGTHDLTAERGTFENNGSSDTLTVNHTSGSGKGINVSKGGNGEALLVTKTSGSGNAMAVVGGRTSLVDLSLSSVSNATGNFLTISGGVVHQRTPSETRSDVGAQAQLNGTGFVKASGTTITYDNSTYQVTSEKAQPNGYASLDSNGKVPLVQINDALIGNVNFQGLWNAATNTPTLANPPASGTKGYYYIVSTAGTFAGISFEVGDWIISNGTAWGKVDNTDAVSSVFGRTGNVTATNGDYNTSQVTENTNLYYTEARVNANTNVAANTAARHNAVTLGTANGLSLSTQVLSLQLATSGQNGALSSTDWSTFNNKENAITAGTTAQYFRGDKTFQSLNTGVVPESGNLYFTNARAIASVLTGYTSGAGTISAADSILSAIQKLNGNIGALVTGVSSVNGQTGVVVLTTTNIAEGTNLYYTEARVNANTNVAANTAARHAAVTLGTANGLSLSTQQLSLGLASAGVTGALSGTDWSTFNSKQQALNGTGFVKISGTTISYDNTSYLPLTGGTLTGALGGTSASFSGNLSGAGLISNSIGNAATPVSTAGWFKIGRIDSRGGGIITLSFIGGSFSPVTYVIKYYKDWTNQASLILEKYGNASWITGCRIRQDASDSIYYIEIDCVSNVNGLQFEVYHDKILGYNATGTAFTGLLLAGSVTGTTIDSISFINGISLDGSISSNSFIKIDGTSSQFLKADGSVDSNTYYLASNPSAFIALTALSGTAPIQYNNTTGAISITQASGSTNGFLSSTDWNTFNNKQVALNGTGFVKISGTTISYDNSTYLTGNQTITLSGVVTGSGTTAITTAIANGAITNAMLANSSFFVGTTSISLGRASAAQTLTGVSIDGNAATVGTFGESSFAVNQRGGNISLNTVLDDNSQRNGMYRVNSGVSSSPNSGRFYSLIRYGNESNVVGQLASDFQTGETFTRAYNSSWSAWRNLIDNVNVNSFAVGLSGNQTINGVKTFASTIVGSINGNAGTVTNGVYTSRTITINGTTQDLSDNRVYNVGTVTSVAALTLGTTGTDLSSSVANGTTTPIITLNVPTASAANRGALSAADWTTFNGKENGITAGTTAQYYRGDKTFQTLNTAAVPELTNLYYTEARVNANTNVAANTAARHNAVTIGTANGLSLSTQQLSLGLASSSANGALSSTDWTTFNNKQNALTNPVTGTGTAGQVAYWSSGSAITGESNLFWDATNDRLGIGTATPGAKLEVNGGSILVRSTSNQTINLYNNGSVAANIGGTLQFSGTYRNSDFDSVVYASIFGGKENATDGNFAGYMSFRTYTHAGSFSERMRITSSGNVLIGTTTDNGAKFQVSGEGTFSASVRANKFTSIASSSYTNDFVNTNIGTVGQTVGIRFGYDGSTYNKGAVYFISKSAAGVGDLIFALNNSENSANVSTSDERMRLTSSGNLGLGVTPSAWGITPALQVVRASIYNQGDDGTYITSNGYFNAGWKYIGASTATQYQMLSGQHRWFNAPSGTAGNAISFTQAMTLGTNSGLSIGTPSAAPAQGLLVQGTIVASAQGGNIQIKGPTDGFLGVSSTSTLFLTDWATGAKGLQINLSTGAATFSSSVQSNSQFFGFSNLNDPTTSTTLATTYSLNGNSATNPFGIGLSAIRNSNYDMFFQTGPINGGGYRFYRGTSELVTILNNGNVLIGTTTDNANKLRVNGSIWADGSIRSSNGTITTLLGFDAVTGPAGILNTTSGHQLWIQTGGITRIAVEAGGNVTIGSVAASERLVVYESAIDSKCYVQIQNNRTRNAGVLTRTSNGSFIAGTSINTDTFMYQIYDNVAAQNRLVVTSDGNILINTTDNSGGERLRVAGTTFTDAIVTMRPASTTVKSDVWKLGRAALATSAEPEDIWVRVQIGTKNYDLLAIDRGTA